MRQAIRVMIRPAFTIILVGCALSCGPRSAETEFSPMLVDAQGRPSLGHLEHRGEMYELRDWRLAGYDAGERNETIADFFPGPTIADEGRLTGLLNGSFRSVLGRFTVIDIEQQFLIFGFEDEEEDQCVEIADVDWPVLADLRLAIPE